MTWQAALHDASHWLTHTIPGLFLLYLAGTGLIGQAFQRRSDAEWNELKALRWPWRAYLHWARFWAFVGGTARTIGLDGPKASVMLRTFLFARQASALFLPADEDTKAPPLASTSDPPKGLPPGHT